ncbi:MAG: signal peptidase I [Planctomycetota bacterium]|jgi:signal peptidase I
MRDAAPSARSAPPPPADPATPAATRRRLAPRVRELRGLVVLVVVLVSFRSAVADWNDVPTQSMEPTVLVGDRILVNKLAYGLRIPLTFRRLATWGGPARGDIVVFIAPDTGRRTVKRVIGVPGDRIAMRDNRLFVNGRAVPVMAPRPAVRPLTDPPPHRFQRERIGDVVHEMMFQPRRAAAPRSFPEIRVPPDRYFVMGDNRDNSADSRRTGFVPRDRILGRVRRVALSFDRDRWYRPRWGRFLRPVD